MLSEFLGLRKSTYQHRKKRNESLMELLFLREYYLDELLDLFFEKLIEHRMSNRSKSELNIERGIVENLFCGHFWEESFLFERCWVKSREKEGQRLRFNKICFN